MAKPGDALLTTTARRDPRGLLLLLNAAIATTGGLLIPAALAKAVDMAISGTLELGVVLFLLALAATEIVGDAIGIVLAASISARATAWLRKRLTRHLLALGHPSPFAAGDSVSRLTGDCAIAGGIFALLLNIGIAVVTSAGAVVALALLDWRLAVVFLLSVPLALMLVRTHMRLTADDVLAYQEVSGEISARLLDSVTGLRTITAAGIADRETARVLQPLPRLASSGIGMWRTQGKMIWRAGLLVPAVQVAVLTAAGFGVMAGRLTIGDVLAVLGYVGLGMVIVGQMTLLTTLERTRASATRIAEVLDTAAPIREDAGLPAGDGEITLNNVHVGEALRDIQLTVAPGAFVAVVGRSGAGKSALAATIGGLVTPDSGEVLLDGVPVGRTPRHAVGYAFDKPSLLGATVGTAVAYGSSATEDDVLAACRAAQVHDVVVRLPHGYDTPMADTPLSGGELQRLGLARAIVREPRVLVLDDATASLDTVTEAKVDSAITSALPGRTRVVVTHRVSIASRADLVVWLDEGRVRGTGTHEELWRDDDYREVFTGGDH